MWLIKYNLACHNAYAPTEQCKLNIINIKPERTIAYQNYCTIIDNDVAIQNESEILMKFIMKINKSKFVGNIVELIKLSTLWNFKLIMFSGEHVFKSSKLNKDINFQGNQYQFPYCYLKFFSGSNCTRFNYWL